jgi:tetratricopeptide (TPR) repeat protein
MKLNHQTLFCVSLFAMLTLPGYTQVSTERQHIETAEGYANAGQWSYANHEWRAALAENPESLTAHVGLAQTLMQSGQNKEAVKHLQAARKHIHKLTLDLTYAEALRRIGENEQTANLYRAILEQAPMNIEAFRQLADLLPSLQETQQKAIRQYLDRRAIDASIKGRVAIKEGNYPAAVESFAISTAYAPKSRDVNDYAVSLMLLGRYEEALAQLGKIQELQAPTWQHQANLALVNLGKGQPERAGTDIERAIGQCANDSQKALLYNVLGFIYENQSKWLKARNAYQRALELEPGLIKARMNLAYAYQKDQAYPEAISTYRDLLLREPNDISLWNRLGFVYELSNKERLALLAYKKATELAPNDPEAHYNLTLLYKKMGKQKESDLAYKSVMRIEFQKMEAGERELSTLKATGTGRQSGSNERNPKHRLLEYVDVFFSNEMTNNAAMI